MQRNGQIVQNSWHQRRALGYDIDDGLNQLINNN